MTALQAGGGGYDAETEAVPAYVSHRRPLGTGCPPDDIAWLWTLAALIAALQTLLTASIGFSAAKERSASTG